MAARVSVVVPIYNVAPYLHDCLTSIAQQSFDDFEVVMVEDGSTDDSPAIAERFVAADSRFRLVRQPNGGLGSARNTGVRHARGEYLAFVDSDDLLQRHAYELMVASLDRTGSDIVSGNVRRLSVFGTEPTKFLARTFASARPATHITRFPLLMSDRLAYNKMWRRTFYDRHELSFPEGKLYEDVWVTVPAHFLARTVDVLDETVYLWRIRSGDNQSITQRRAELRALQDRADVCRHVSRFLAAHRFAAGKRQFDRRVVAGDLAVFLNVLDIADTDFRERFIEIANEFLGEASPDVTAGVRAIDRLKWHLVGQRDLDAVLEVLAAEDRGVTRQPPVRVRKRWYGDYPFRGDPQRAIPPAVYALGAELSLTWRLERLAWQGDLLRLEGVAYIQHLGAAAPDAQQVRLFAVGPRGRIIRLSTVPVHRPDANTDPDATFDAEWAGFTATLDLSTAERDGRPEGRWEVHCEVRAGGVTRSSTTPAPVGLLPLLPVMRPGTRNRRVMAFLTPAGRLVVETIEDRSVIRRCRLVAGEVEVAGDLDERLSPPDALQLSRRSGARSLSYPLTIDRRTAGGASFTARVPVADLVSELDLSDAVAHTERTLHGVGWNLRLGDRPVAVAADLSEPSFVDLDRQITLSRNGFGDACLVEGAVQHVIDAAEWWPDGVLRVSGRYAGSADGQELLLRPRGRSGELAVPIVHDPGRERFTAELTPGRMTTLAGDLPMRRGVYDLLVRRAGPVNPMVTSMSVEHRALSSLPQRQDIAGKSFSVGAWEYDEPVLQVGGGCGVDLAAGYHQSRLRADYGRSRRTEALRDSVVYQGRHGGPYAGNLRALHEELVRRQLDLEHLWVVDDDAWEVPATARLVRAGSADHYDALAASRYVLAEGRLPSWFSRRPEQVDVQTGYASPVKLFGADLAARPRLTRDLRRWQSRPAADPAFLLSAGTFATEILSRAAAPGVGAEILESGAPGHDLVIGADRDVVRARLGLPDDRVVVLYAPTYRDNLRAPDGYWTGPTPDLDALRAALGDSHVLLIRRHWSVVDPLPYDPSSFTRDVSRYPDVGDLVAAADVVVSDYSSVLVLNAARRRPTVVFAPDLERYRDEVRGCYVGDEIPWPGGVATSTEAVIEAVVDPVAHALRYREQVEAFAAAYCPRTDGKSAARVIDRVFR